MKLLRPLFNRNLLMLASLGAVLMPQVSLAQGGLQPSCSAWNLKGTYIFSGTGTFAPVGPLAAGGKIIYDGNGNAQGTATQSFAGTIFRNVAFTASYKVNSDCTGSIIFTYTATGVNSTFDFVIDPSGATVTSICTDPGGTLVLNGTRVVSRD
jgi:hypothetical protein